MRSSSIVAQAEDDLSHSERPIRGANRVRGHGARESRRPSPGLLRNPNSPRRREMDRIRGKVRDELMQPPLQASLMSHRPSLRHAAVSLRNSAVTAEIAAEPGWSSGEAMV